MPTLVLFRGGEILVFFSKLNTKSHYDNVSFWRMSNSFFLPPLLQIFKILHLLCSPFFKFAGIWIEDIFLKGSIFQKNDNYDKCLDHRKLSVSVWSQQHENRGKLFKRKQLNKGKQELRKLPVTIPVQSYPVLTTMTTMTTVTVATMMTMATLRKVEVI